MAWQAAVPGVLGGLYGGNKEQQALKDAERKMDELSGAWSALGVPELDAIEMERYANTYNPEMQAASEMSGIQIDPVLKQAQMDALAQLGDLSQGGLNLQDKAALLDVQNQVGQQDAGRQAAIMQNMQERGMGGAGAELAQRMASQQGSADRAASAGRDTAALAQQRALDAISRRGQLGGQMRNQAFGEDAQKAKAQDAINAFNTGNRNQAGIMRQDISNKNTDMANTEAGQDNVLAQQQFNNEVAKMSGRSGVDTTRAGITADKGAAENKMYSSLGSAGSQAAGSYMDNNKKKPAGG